MLTRVMEGVEVDDTCMSEVGAALSTGMEDEETVILCNAVPNETPPAERTLA